MAIPMFLARQLSHPSGLVGRLVAWLMNRGNARMNAGAVGLVEPSADDVILEIGFGGGPNLDGLCARAALVEGEVHAMPLPDAACDKALTVNTIYFWKDRPTALRELARVLAPGGRLVIGFLPADRMEKDESFPREVFTYVRPEDLTVELAAAGFESVRIDRPEGVAWVFAVAARRA